MPSDAKAYTAHLTVELLETRLAPATTVSVLETFDTTPLGSLPSGWAQWSSNGSSSFAVSNTRSFSGPESLASSGLSNLSGRAWLAAQQPADVQVSSEVYLDSLVPIQVLARGSNLNSSNSTYYALSIQRGLTAQLVRVVNGVATSLGTITSASWYSGQWAQVNLWLSGTQIKAQVYRADTKQYLNSSGQWQSAQAWAISRSDTAISAGGLTGVARSAGCASTVSLDNFSVTGTGTTTESAGTVQETFDTTPLGSLPSNWTQWSNTGSASFAVSNSRPFSGAGSLASSVASNLSGRAWLAVQQPADVQVGADIYLDSLVPIQILARGSNLNSSSPTYYALSIQRGLSAQLLRVVNGVTTSLGTITSSVWFSSQWVEVTLSLSGTQIKAQVYRADTKQYLNTSGQWQSAQAWAISRSDASISAGGLTGVARAADYSGTVSLDNFSVTEAGTSSGNGATVQEMFDTTPRGSLPSGWAQWSNNGSTSFAVSNTRSFSGANSITSSGTSSLNGRAWLAAQQAADVQVGAEVYLDGLIPLQVLARGSNLNSSSPSYYSLSIQRGLCVQLLRVVNGVTTSLGSLSSASWFSAQWVEVALSVSGTQIKAQVYRPDTKQYLNSSGQWQSAQAWAISRSDASISGKGLTGVARSPGYSGNVYLDNFTVTPLGTDSGSNPPSTIVVIPQHYSWIRIAQLAYSGTTLGSLEDQLLRNSVDLVVTDVPYLSNHISTVAPNTPQLAYINFTSLYLSLLTDWLNFADQQGLSRESAFYHVSKATPFTGDSASSQPVNWFWSVYVGGGTPVYTDVTSSAHDSTADPFTFGGTGQATYIGYPDRFREINFSLVSAAASGWTCVLEYPTAVDSFGNPTAWSTLPVLSEGTRGLTRSGQITFDPPSNWKPVSLNGTAALYYIRIRTVTSGRAPVVSTILGRDYVNAQGGSTGVIPAFDYSADLNKDGYLSDAEYARRKSGMNARFVYESRLFFGYYGQMRFMTNPASSGLRRWAIDYSKRYLATRSNSAGLFVDNSNGNPMVDDPTCVLESLSTYASDYGALLKVVGQAISPDWLMVNTAGGGTQADSAVSQTTAYFEEFALRPLSTSWRHFQDLAAMVAHRANLNSPSPYAILDSLPTGGSPTDSRTQLATLAEYYLLADPTYTFLDFFGGYEPGTSWSRHWCQAVTYNVGKPTGSWSLFASGADPSDIRFSYRVYQRRYTNALVLFKPLSSDSSGQVGSLANNTATYHKLDGTYRPLRADGTLGSPVTSITLRNGEGAILIKV
jgi:hypothetical protein